MIDVIDDMLAVLVGLALPAAAALSGRRGKAQILETAEKIRLYWTNSAGQWFLALLVAGAWVLQGRKLSHLGLVFPKISGISAAIIFLVVAGVIIDSGLQVRNSESIERMRLRWIRDTPFMPANRIEFAHYVAMAVSAAVCEELMFRGFLIRYLEDLFAGGVIATPLAIILPALIFGISHWYQGPWRATKILVFAVAFGSLFVLTSSLLVPTMLHAGLDLSMGVVSLWILRGTNGRGRSAV